MFLYILIIKLNYLFFFFLAWGPLSSFFFFFKLNLVIKHEIIRLGITLRLYDKLHLKIENIYFFIFLFFGQLFKLKCMFLYIYTN